MYGREGRNIERVWTANGASMITKLPNEVHGNGSKCRPGRSIAGCGLRHKV